GRRKNRKRLVWSSAFRRFPLGRPISCPVPKEPMIIARHFNAGYRVVKMSSPDGTFEHSSAIPHCWQKQVQENQKPAHLFSSHVPVAVLSSPHYTSPQAYGYHL